MPYKLRKAPKRDLYWVVSVETGKKHSNEPIEKSKAEAQMRILDAAMEGEMEGGMMGRPRATPVKKPAEKKPAEKKPEPKKEVTASAAAAPAPRQKGTDSAYAARRAVMAAPETGKVGIPKPAFRGVTTQVRRKIGEGKKRGGMRAARAALAARETPETAARASITPTVAVAPAATVTPAARASITPTVAVAPAATVTPAALPPIKKLTVAQMTRQKQEDAKKKAEEEQRQAEQRILARARVAYKKAEEARAIKAIEKKAADEKRAEEERVRKAAAAAKRVAVMAQTDKESKEAGADLEKLAADQGTYPNDSMGDISRLPAKFEPVADSSHVKGTPAGLRQAEATRYGLRFHRHPEGTPEGNLVPRNANGTPIEYALPPAPYTVGAPEIRRGFPPIENEYALIIDAAEIAVSYLMRVLKDAMRKVWAEEGLTTFAGTVNRLYNIWLNGYRGSDFGVNSVLISDPAIDLSDIKALLPRGSIGVQLSNPHISPDSVKLIIKRLEIILTNLRSKIGPISTMAHIERGEIGYGKKRGGATRAERAEANDLRSRHKANLHPHDKQVLNRIAHDNTDAPINSLARQQLDAVKVKLSTKAQKNLLHTPEQRARAIELRERFDWPKTTSPTLGAYHLLSDIAKGKPLRSSETADELLNEMEDLVDTHQIENRPSFVPTNDYTSASTEMTAPHLSEYYDQRQRAREITDALNEQHREAMASLTPAQLRSYTELRLRSMLGAPPSQLEYDIDAFRRTLPPNESGSGKKHKSISISKPAFIKEHKNLIKVLKKGKKSELRAEAQDQSHELGKVLEGGVRIATLYDPFWRRGHYTKILDNEYKSVLASNPDLTKTQKEVIRNLHERAVNKLRRYISGVPHKSEAGIAAHFNEIRQRARNEYDEGYITLADRDSQIRNAEADEKDYINARLQKELIVRNFPEDVKKYISPYTVIEYKQIPNPAVPLPDYRDAEHKAVEEARAIEEYISREPLKHGEEMVNLDNPDTGKTAYDFGTYLTKAELRGLREFDSPENFLNQKVNTIAPNRFKPYISHMTDEPIPPPLKIENPHPMPKKLYPKRPAIESWLRRTLGIVEKYPEEPPPPVSESIAERHPEERPSENFEMTNNPLMALRATRVPPPPPTDNGEGLGIEGHGHGHGGAWSDILNPSKIINEVVNPDSIVRRRISALSKGIRVGFSPSSRKTIENYGTWVIDMVVIRRVPIRPAINDALQLITLGQWNTARAELNQDILFHLGIMVRVKQGNQHQYLIITKNAVVNVRPTQPNIQGQEVLESNVPANTTLTTFLNKGIAAAGDAKFFTYDPFTNNCQDFVALLLSANGLYSDKAQTFTKQNIEQLIAKIPSYTHAVAKGVTDLGALANVAIEGGAKAQSHSFKDYLQKENIDPSLYLKEAQGRAKKAGYPYKLLGFANDGEHKLAIPDAHGKIIKFGRVGYGDHIIWSHLEEMGEAPPGKATQKRQTFHKSHEKLPGDWKSEKFSPNNLALRVLW